MSTLATDSVLLMLIDHFLWSTRTQDMHDQKEWHCRSWRVCWKSRWGWCGRL